MRPFPRRRAVPSGCTSPRGNLRPSRTPACSSTGLSVRGSSCAILVVEAAIRGHTPDTSVRFLQYRFSRATGLTHMTIRQIERARSVVSLLEQGTPISDAALELGYFDQAHLTNSLKRFVGRTPAQIARRSTVGSLRFSPRFRPFAVL